MSAILIIDHETPPTRRYDAFLADMGMAICSETTATAALSTARDPQKQIEVVLLRWEFTDGGKLVGTDLLSKLKAERPALPVIVISDIVSLERTRSATLLGSSDFLQQPLERERLRNAIWNVLRKTEEPKLLAKLRKEVVGESPTLLAALRKLAQFIPEAGINVLLIGENGTGKERLAQAVHQLGPNKKEPWVACSVAEVPDNLIESKLFGHVKGAFTDASSSRQGIFEQVGSGTLFLDEIGELKSHLQAKLLRVLQERSFRAVGGEKDLKFSGRLVCATNRNLAYDVAAGRFRSDLYYRLNSCEVHLPALRERGRDLWLLIDYFLEQFAPGREIRLVREARGLLEEYPLPGNIRELADIIRHAVVRQGGNEILLDDLPLDVMYQRVSGVEGVSNSATPADWSSRYYEMPHKEAIALIEKEFNRHYLPRLHEATRGNITQAAKLAAMDPKTFRKKWQEAGLPPLSPKDSQLLGN